MKSISLISSVAMVLLLNAGVVQAEDHRNSQAVNHHLSKRPYQAPQNEAGTPQTEQWEGAALVKDEAAEDKASPTKYQQLRIRMLGQRPYMDGNK